MKLRCNHCIYTWMAWGRLQWSPHTKFKWHYIHFMKMKWICAKETKKTHTQSGEICSFCMHMMNETDKQKKKLQRKWRAEQKNSEANHTQGKLWAVISKMTINRTFKRNMTRPQKYIALILSLCLSIQRLLYHRV